jgi:hypothetical protein
MHVLELNDARTVQMVKSNSVTSGKFAIGEVIDEDGFGDMIARVMFDHDERHGGGVDLFGRHALDSYHPIAPKREVARRPSYGGVARSTPSGDGSRESIDEAGGHERQNGALSELTDIRPTSSLS